MFKRVLIVLAAACVAMQFYRPPKNVSPGDPSGDISTAFAVQPDLKEILFMACYDCHSNSTRYPWYAEIQPIGWFLNGHIQDGKRQLNFSEFANYRPRRQYRKLEEIAENVESGDMPLPAYLIAHADAQLTENQKEILITFAREARASMEARYPADSLKGRNR